MKLPGWGLFRPNSPQCAALHGVCSERRLMVSFEGMNANFHIRAPRVRARSCFEAKS